MEYPQEVVIGPHRVVVRELVGSKNIDDVGEADTQSNIIVVRPGLAPSQEVETILHEVVHFMLGGLPLGDPMEECVTVILGRALTAFIRDNPTWVRQFSTVLSEEKRKCLIP